MMIHRTIGCRIAFALGVSLVTVLAGCGGAPQLMPTPNLYTRGDVNPFLGVSEDLQNNKVEVVYATDRVPEDKTPDHVQYGYKRSRSVGFGVSEVRFGKDVSWADLVKASTSKKREVDLTETIPRTTELGRFQPTPRSLIQLTGSADDAAASDAAEKATEDQFRKLLADQLAHTRVKEVFLFVHGYNNTFKDSVRTIAEVWHFMGREGVPVAYTWPAGSGGLLRGYTYDRESSEFTVYHLKQMLRLIASCPEVTKVHVIGHSRGTDVVTSAIRELHLEISGGGKTARQVLKFGTLVLAAPDLDIDVMIQRNSTARIGQVAERSAIYVCASDNALGFSSFLFGGLNRLGKLKSDLFSPQELEALRNSKTTQIIDARVSDSGAFGHDYFHSNPAVSSDLILLMRYGFATGAENGRPLRVDKKGFWVIDDDYPGPQIKPLEDVE